MEHCPYCTEQIEINHDDGYGYQEDEIYEQECHHCGNIFTYTTATIYYYTLDKCPCKNGSDHKLKEIHGFPKEFFKYKRRCEYCGEEFVIDEAAHRKEMENYFKSLNNSK